MQVHKLIKQKHSEILAIALSYGATSVRIFGSAARGQAKPSSDLDILVSMKPGATLLDIIAIKQDLEDLLGISVDVVTENSLSPYIRDEVLKEAVNL
ncbi:MAG: nucleotidyltransferase family protein [Pseudomonadota bacterium]